MTCSNNFCKILVSLTVPDGVKSARSVHAGEFPDTSRILTIYQNRDGLFSWSLPEGMMDSPFWKRFGIFIPDYVKPGDVVTILWQDETCACAKLLLPI